MNKKIIILIAVVLILISGFVFLSASTYHAGSNATGEINSSGVIEIDNGLFINGSGSGTAIIFYPGANVEYISYLPLLKGLSDKGVDCFLVEMPMNLAILDSGAASSIIDNYNYSNYYVAGHSLGGAMAASFAHDNPDTVDGVILLAGYSTENISNLKVLSVYGSEDKVLNLEKYNDTKANLGNFTELVIPGANHAQFGDYGSQNGDGIASISGEKQRQITQDAILSFV